MARSPATPVESSSLLIGGKTQVRSFGVVGYLPRIGKAHSRVGGFRMHDFGPYPNAPELPLRAAAWPPTPDRAGTGVNGLQRANYDIPFDLPFQDPRCLATASTVPQMLGRLRDQGMPWHSAWPSDQLAPGFVRIFPAGVMRILGQALREARLAGPFS
ncbi:hypothetical protein B0T17DRAFT_504965 [Bombardia bombarda]|uniref:Uncharacterized protein n=1 Tax=Bombardia bombarda TaxID=252184 RepID=A0AA39X6M3_9PEZI|nr:hypothetical protein B0T17DRAFT_504965 [Bombardia bombarda]